MLSPVIVNVKLLCLIFHLIIIKIIVSAENSKFGKEIIVQDAADKDNKLHDLMLQAKKHFLEKEKTYLEHKPLSKNLLTFISKYTNSRNKRDSNTKNGDPIDEMNTKAADDGDENKEVTEQSIDKQLLEKVVADVDELIKFKNEGKLSGREGAMCNLAGLWDSAAGGVQFNITKSSNTDCQQGKKLTVAIADMVPPASEGFLCDGTWHMVGLEPFQHSTLFVLNAYHTEGKRIATFIGECRICEGTDTVSGMWMIGRASRDCKDREANHITISDIWRKYHIKALHDERLHKVSLASTTSN